MTSTRIVSGKPTEMFAPATDGIAWSCSSSGSVERPTRFVPLARPSIVSTSAGRVTSVPPISIRAYPKADARERVAARGRQRREEADRGEPGDRVDLGQEDLVATQQEVDPGKALGADRAIRIARDLQDRRPERCGDLGRGRRLRKPGR